MSIIKITIQNLTVVVVIVLADLSVLAQADDWNTLEKDNYSIEYPQEWQLDESGQMGTSFILVSPRTSGNDPFMENVTLVIQDLTGHDIDLDQFVEISENQVRTVITNGTLLESNRMKDQSPEYHKIIYTGTQGVYDLKFEQYYWVIENKAYILTFTCESAQFDAYREVGERVMGSFRLE